MQHNSNVDHTFNNLYYHFFLYSIPLMPIAKTISENAALYYDYVEMIRCRYIHFGQVTPWMNRWSINFSCDHTQWNH